MRGQGKPTSSPEGLQAGIKRFAVIENHPSRVRKTPLGVTMPIDGSVEIRIAHSPQFPVREIGGNGPLFLGAHAVYRHGHP